VQFALDPTNGRQVVIEMNPRVSRSSALASKATGFPIAKIAARLAVGYTLDEIPNDITEKTPASFEPTIDYVVTKVPRWNFEKFPGTPAVLGSQMQAVGEVMAIGRTFTESLQKALRSLELGRFGLNCDPGEKELDDVPIEELLAQSAIGTPNRIWELEAVLRRGKTVDEVYDATKVDPWFLDQMLVISEERARLAEVGLHAMGRADWRRAKRHGFSDEQLAYLWDTTWEAVSKARREAGVFPTYKTVDTCGAEFEADTPYHYSTWEDTSEVAASDRPKVIILGSGPNRIGQGIEFDYCCVHASFALRDAGYETIMVNCNPETVSTDYDTSDRLYFEPLTHDDVMNIIEAEQESAKAGGGPGIAGIIVSLGGQTPLKLAGNLPADLIAGTSPESIDLAEDRERWNALCERLNIPQPPGGTATTVDEAVEVVSRVGYPALMRPSYVLGGRAMTIVHDEVGLREAMAELTAMGSLGREGGLSAERPVLVDRFLEDAIEVDVDAIRDSTGDSIIGGIMEHVEEAGVHSGDSACMIPPQSLPAEVIAELESAAKALADELQVVGLLNVQFAVTNTDGERTVYVIEANPRASRTVPFVAKATGRPLVKIATRVMLGASLEELRTEGLLGEIAPGDHVAVKEAVLPFNRFPETDQLLGPEMRSTGEVMGIDLEVGLAFAKSQLAAGTAMPDSGLVFFSVADRDKAVGLSAARSFIALGFEIVATAGTAAALRAEGIEVRGVAAKVGAPAGEHDASVDLPDAVALIEQQELVMVINTPRGRGAHADGDYIRSAASRAGLPLFTTVSAALAAANGIADRRLHPLKVRPLQAYHQGVHR